MMEERQIAVINQNLRKHELSCVTSTSAADFELAPPTSTIIDVQDGWHLLAMLSEGNRSYIDNRSRHIYHRSQHHTANTAHITR
jgi:hypothetical protein